MRSSKVSTINGPTLTWKSQINLAGAASPRVIKHGEIRYPMGVSLRGKSASKSPGLKWTKWPHWIYILKIWKVDNKNVINIHGHGHRTGKAMVGNQNWPRSSGKRAACGPNFFDNACTALVTVWQNDVVWEKSTGNRASLPTNRGVSCKASNSVWQKFTSLQSLGKLVIVVLAYGSGIGPIHQLF